MTDDSSDEGATWRGMRRRLRADGVRLRRYQHGKFGYRPLAWFLDPAWACVALHRLSHLMWRRGWTRGARLMMQANSLATGADIHPASDLGAGLLIPSPCGVNISARAGGNLAVLPLAGIGGSVRDADVGAGVGLPRVGRDVTVNWFTGVQGSITVGDGVVFGPGVGAVVSVAAGKHMSLRHLPREGEPAAALEAAPRAPQACLHGSWRETRAAMRSDVDRYLAELAAYAPPGQRPPPRVSAVLTNPLLALFAYRVSHWLHLNGWRRTAMLVCQSNILLHKLTLPPAACLGGGVLMPHLGGTLFHGRAGAGLTHYAGALCTCRGAAWGAAPQTAPCLGENVLLAGHAGAFGAIEVGSGAQLGPKAQLACDLAAGWQVWDPMARGSAHAPGEPLADPPREVSPPPGHRLSAAHPWRETRQRLRMDRERLRGAPRFPAFTCVWLYRMSHALHATGRRRRARLLWLLNIWITGADITPCCEIGGGMLIAHPAGVVLHCRAGEALSVGAIAGITSALDADDRPAALERSPLLGSGVELSHHSAAFGAVTLGDAVALQPGCIATRSVPAGTALLPRKLRFRDPAAVAAVRSRAARPPAEAVAKDAATEEE
jgi:serine O-acetyltransferase